MMINRYRYTNGEGNYFMLFIINFGFWTIFLSLYMTNRKQASEFNFWFHFLEGIYQLSLVMNLLVKKKIV